MATKKYLTLDGLTEYDGLIKDVISDGDASVKSYVDTELAKKADKEHSHEGFISYVENQNLTEDQKVIGRENINAKPKDLIATITGKTENGSVVYTCDTSSADLWAAHEAGRNVIFNIGGLTFINAEFLITASQSDSEIKQVRAMLFTNAKTGHLYVVNEDDTVTFTNSNFVTTANVKQETGIDRKMPMSQKAVTDELSLKADKADVTTLQGLVGDTAVSEQISEAISELPQADWNQNDETSSDYIKNRTHYETSNKTVLIPETTKSSASVNKSILFDATALDWTLGNKVNVIFDGNKYEATCINNSEDWYEYRFYTSETGYIGFWENGAIYSYDRNFDFSIGVEHTFEVYTGEAIVKQLDEKFIPDTIARTTYVDEQINTVNTIISTKADLSHNHDDLYYTETEIDALIDGVDSSISKITSGTTPVKEAEHATNADNATSSLDAEKLGGQLPSYYAKASDIPTGALADKDVVSESDLDSELAAKVNAAAEGNHSHSNKTVLDGITSEKVSAWDSAEANAKAYADTAASDAATAVKNDLLNGAGAAYDTLKELGDLIDENVDAIDALNDVAASKADKSDLEALETSIGEQISEAISEIPQPDWNQNDETASDYIKNKPFGEKIGFDTYIEEQIVEFAASGSGARAELDYLKYIEWDAICNVYFDGVLYENIAAYESSGDMSVYVDFTTENGDRISICESSVIYAPASYVGQTHTIKAGVVSNIITPIENKYLGISVAPGTGTNSVRLNDLDSTVASGEYSHAEGYHTTASKYTSHAEGAYTTASGIYSHAEGYSTIASEYGSHAEGENTTASAYASHAEGSGTIASGNYSHAEGNYTIARGNSQHVSGSYNIAETPHIIKETVLTSTEYICKSKDKVNIHICDGYTFDAETGLFTLTPINWDSVVTPTSSSPMGYSDVYMIYGNESGKTMYYNADFVAYNSGAEVRANVGTTKYESIDVSLNKGKYIEIVGNGTSNSARSNAHTLDWDGNAWFAGDVTVGADAKKLATEESVTALSERIGDTSVSEQISGAIDGLATEEYVNTAKADKEHSHEISEITNLQTTLNNAASGIQTNTDSINAHTDRISALEASVGEFSAITTAEIQALFA